MDTRRGGDWDPTLLKNRRMFNMIQTSTDDVNKLYV